MDKVMIHLFEDDKFADVAIELFEKIHDIKSKYYVHISSISTLKYIKSDLIQIWSDELLENELQLDDSIKTIYFFHSLSQNNIRICNLINGNVYLVWLSWGFDLYNNWPLFRLNLYEQFTKKLFNKKPFFKRFKERIYLNWLVFQLFDRLKLQTHNPSNKIIKILNKTYNTKFIQTARKMNLIIPVVETEWQLIKQLRLNAKVGRFTYGYIEELTIGLERPCSGANILIGNSGNPTNNHLDIFEQIKEFNFGNRKLIVPLSYSGNDSYINKVVRCGNNYFGDNFMPILEFMPKIEYNRLINSCGYLIFGHIRQQGFGNILALGYKGCKIFLSGKNPIFKSLKSKGFHLKKLCNISENEINSSLSRSEVETNSLIIKNEYSKQVVQNRTRYLIDQILKDLEF